MAYIKRKDLKGKVKLRAYHYQKEIYKVIVQVPTANLTASDTIKFLELNHVDFARKYMQLWSLLKFRRPGLCGEFRADP